jgi:putative acetyltransferase
MHITPNSVLSSPSVRIKIVEARPDSADATALIDELESHLASHYPSESRHGYSIEKLLREGVSFFLIYQDDQAAGCGGIQLFGTDYAELKRMYVRPRFRGLGLGKAMVEHLCAHASENGVNIIRLETGIHQREAIALYERMGFAHIGPFGSYRNDPLSAFYERAIG